VYYAERMATYSFQLVGFGLVESPKGAVEYLDRNDVQGKMFNEYGMGGYLIWKTWPKRKVFVDGRNVEYGPELVKSVGTWMRPGGFRQLDDAYQFDYAIIINGDSYSCWELDRDPRWTLVYFDDESLVYLKREPANEKLIARDAYRILKPNHVSYGYLNDALGRPDKTAEALDEIERAIKTAEDNVGAHQMKSYLLSELKRPEEALAAAKEAVDRFPKKPGPYLSLGWFYERSGDLPKAAGAYEEAARLARGNNDWMSGSVALNNWGTIEYRRGDHKKAASLYRECLELNAGFSEAKRNLGKVEAKL
jgi:tetratricopeptide (TPR) repeat protein